MYYLEDIQRVGVTEEEVGDEVRLKQVIHCANP